MLEEGRVLDVRNVVWCTGFRPDFSWIRFPFEIGDDGYPVQYRGAVASSPGLYFAGLPFLHSFASMLIGGAGETPSASRGTSSRCGHASSRRSASRACWRSRTSASPRDRGAVLVWNGLVSESPALRGGAAASVAAMAARRRMFHVVLTRAGPEYDLSKPLEEQSRWGEHADFMDGLVDEGFIVLGGPLADEFRNVHVVDAESEAEVRDTLACDPWSGSHLEVDSVDPWTIRLDGRPQ